jgi:hypothetical protein
LSIAYGFQQEEKQQKKAGKEHAAQALVLEKILRRLILRGSTSIAYLLAHQLICVLYLTALNRRNSILYLTALRRRKLAQGGEHARARRRKPWPWVT